MVTGAGFLQSEFVFGVLSEDCCFIALVWCNRFASVPVDFAFDNEEIVSKKLVSTIKKVKTKNVESTLFCDTNGESFAWRIMLGVHAILSLNKSLGV